MIGSSSLDPALVGLAGILWGVVAAVVMRSRWMRRSPRRFLQARARLVRAFGAAAGFNFVLAPPELGPVTPSFV